jgi:hypothetical protein
MKRLLFALALFPLVANAGSIYLCKTYGGALFWSQDHCNVHRALIDRIVSVPDSLPFDQQVQLAQQQRHPGAGVPGNQSSNAAVQPAPAANQNADCKSLEARDRQLSGMARQPQSTTSRDAIRREQDRVSEQRASVRC